MICSSSSCLTFIQWHRWLGQRKVSRGRSGRVPEHDVSNLPAGPPAGTRPAWHSLTLVVPQAVLSPLTRTAIFLVVTVDAGGEAVARDLLSDLSALQRAVGFRDPDGRLSCVAGVGSEAWDRLF